MNLLKDAAYGALAAISPGLGNRGAVLMYHSISERTDYFSTVSPRAFARQMAYLKEKRVPVVSLDELVKRQAAGVLEGAVALTFDDGYEDNYRNAFPVLRKFGFPATIFVTTGLVGGEDKRGMSRLAIAHLREMADSGLIALAPHTRTHPRLPALADDAAREEIRGSGADLEAMLGVRPSFFAYPYGAADERTAGIVRALGYAAAVTVREGTVGPESDPFLLPRNSIDRSTSFAQFRGKTSRAVDRYESLKSLVRPRVLTP